MDYRNPAFDWKPFRAKSDAAYAGQGNVADHSLTAGGTGEIHFALDIARLHFGLSPRGRALDVACGAGYMTKCLSEAGFEASGFDISEEGVARARATYPDLSFSVGNGTAPSVDGRFAFILIREFHPLKVIDDFDYQLGIVHRYLELLEPGGVLVIAHASPIVASYEGAPRRYHGVDFRRLKRELGGCGPFFYFAFKHLGMRPRSRIQLAAVSELTRLARAALGVNWIRYFLIAAPRHPSRQASPSAA